MRLRTRHGQQFSWTEIVHRVFHFPLRLRCYHACSNLSASVDVHSPHAIHDSPITPFCTAYVGLPVPESIKTPEPQLLPKISSNLHRKSFAIPFIQ